MQPANFPRISETISHLKPSLSKSDYERAQYDLNLREARLRSEKDEIARKFQNSLKHNAILTKELEQWKRDHGALLLGQHETQQELTDLKLQYERLVRESSVDLPRLKQERDEFELKLVKSVKEVEILKKQCGHLSQENGELVVKNAGLETEVRVLKGEIVKVEEERKEAVRREKEARVMCEKLRDDLERAEQCRKEELEKTNEKKKKVEGKLEVVMIAASDRYRELARRVTKLENDVAALSCYSASGLQPDSATKAKEQLEKFEYDEVNEVLTGCPSVCETTVQESVPCPQKSAVAPAPIFEITDSDDDDDLPLLKGVKRKLFSSEASNEIEESANSGTNNSKQLKGLGDGSANASIPLAVSVGGRTDMSLISNVKQNPVVLKQCDKKFGIELDGKRQGILTRSVSYCKDGIQDESGYSDKWEYEADMLDALARDAELCMKAVCALYRQQTAHRSFNQISTLRIAILAKFLVNGDGEGRLRRSVAELEKYDPKAAAECRSIACSHAAQLFEIYQKKADPFFAPH